jgi:hypothetical protein
MFAVLLGRLNIEVHQTTEVNGQVTVNADRRRGDACSDVRW